MGPEALAHIREHHEHTDIRPVPYQRLIGALPDKLRACLENDSGSGWGTQVVRGPYWLSLFLLSCSWLSIAASILAGILPVLRRDVKMFCVIGLGLGTTSVCATIVALRLLKRSESSFHEPLQLKTKAF